MIDQCIYRVCKAAFAGQNIYVAFRNANVYGDGIFIDRVAIGTKPPDATSISIDIPKFAALGTINPKATFKNDGDSIISFPVTMNITGGYTSTKNIVNLSPGTTTQVTFDPWVTTSPITAIVSISTHLIGDTFLADDTLSTGIVVMETFTNYGWSVRPNMNAVNSKLASAAINNNISSTLYAFGGNRKNTFTVSDTSDRFLPLSNTWMPSNTTARMIKGVTNASAATVQNKIYIAGGIDNTFNAVNNNQIYNPASNSWSSGFALPIAVSDYAIGVYKDSLIYYMGGYNGSTDVKSVQLFAPM